MNTPIFDENESFRKLLQRSKNIGNDWRQVSEGLWVFVKTQAAKQPGAFELNEEKRQIRFMPYL